MYNTHKHTRKFDSDIPEEMLAYDAVLNNPLNTILSERKEKLTTKTFDAEGGGTEDSTVVLVVTWEEKVLIV